MKMNIYTPEEKKSSPLQKHFGDSLHDFRVMINFFFGKNKKPIKQISIAIDKKKAFIVSWARQELIFCECCFLKEEKIKKHSFTSATLIEVPQEADSSWVINTIESHLEKLIQSQT